MMRKIERENTGLLHAGQDLVVAGYAGLAGTVKLAEAKEEELSRWFSNGYMEEIAGCSRYLLREENGFWRDCGAAEWEPAGEGGILTAIWNLTGAYETGVEFYLRQIPIRQETVEVCERLELNPYRLYSQGCVLLTADNGEIKIYNVGNGIFATVNCPDSCSVISCGGNRASADDVTADISERYSDIEYMIIPNQNNKYSSLERFAVTKFDLNNILVYDNDIEKQNLLNAFDGNSRQTFGGNSHFTLNLSDTVTDEVICVDNTMFQFIKGKNMTVLFVPTDADLSDLPEKYRNPDCLLIDTVPENFDLISCNTVIFSGSEKQFKKNYDSIKEISSTVISTSERNITVNLNGG